MKNKKIRLFFLVGALLCCSIFLGICGMTIAFDRQEEMEEVNKVPWTLHPCDIGKSFSNITYNREFQVFLADGVLDYTGGGEDGSPITQTGEPIDGYVDHPNLGQLYLKAARRTEDGQKRFGCLRYDGSIAIPFEYNGLEGFVGDYCIAWKAPELLLIDKDNEVVYRTEDSSNLTRISAYTFSVTKDGKTEIISLGTDRRTEAADVLWAKAGEFQDGIKVIQSKGKYGLADKDGKVLIKPVFDSLALVGDHYLIGAYRGRYGIAKTDKI